MKIVLMQLMGRGGGQLYTAQISQALAKTGNEVSLFLAEYLYNSLQYEEKKLKIITVPIFPERLSLFLTIINPKTYVDFISRIDRIRPDIIHIVFEDPFSGFLAFFLSLKYPVVVTEHDPRLHDGAKLWLRFFMFFSRLITRHCSNVIIVHGQNLKKILTEGGLPTEKVYVVPHGDYSYFTKWINPDVHEEHAILFFGIINRYKGLEYLFQAVPAILKEFPDLKIIIAGEGDLSRCDKFFNTIRNYEIYNEYIPDHKVAELFQRAAIVVLPYTDASQSGVIHIAYSFKKPVIATNIGSLPEVVDEGKTGFLIPPRNSDAITQSVISLLKSDAKRREMGENAFLKVTNELSWNSIAHKTIMIYESVIQKNTQ